jgi:Family of unknown function (DUF6152)
MTNRIATMMAAIVLSLPAFAHHGTSVTYQNDKTIVLKGTVTEWDFINPHPQIYFDVKDESGNVQHWGSELGPTPLMMKNMKVGWTRESMKPGDQITLTCNPHKLATATACLAKEIVINGKTIPLSAAPPTQQTSAK